MTRPTGGAIAIILLLCLCLFSVGYGDRFMKEVKNSIFKDSNIEIMKRWMTEKFNLEGKLEEMRLKTKESDFYSKQHLTGKSDMKIRKELDKLDNLEEDEAAIRGYQRILKRRHSPRALHSLGRIFKKRAENSEKENKISEAQRYERDASKVFCKVLEGAFQDRNTMNKNKTDVTPFLLVQCCSECIKSHRKVATLVGNKNDNLNNDGKFLDSLLAATELFPHNVEYKIELGWRLMLKGKFARAQSELGVVIRDLSPDNNQASVMLGICNVLSQLSDGEITDDEIFNLTEHILNRDSETKQLVLKDTSSGNNRAIYGQLSTGLRMSNLHREAEMVNSIGYLVGVFPSRWQRSSSDLGYHQQNLKSRPIWSKRQTGMEEGLSTLEKNWKTIRDEAVGVIFDSVGHFEKNLWEQMVLYDRGEIRKSACKLVPKTCEMLESSFPPNSFSSRGQVKFSALYPNTKVLPHTGPTNCRLRTHLGLVVPGNVDIGMRIADKTIRWKEGKMFIIDDSFEHEVWHREKQSCRHNCYRNNTTTNGSSNSSACSNNAYKWLQRIGSNFDEENAYGRSGNNILSILQPSFSGARLVLLVDLWHPDISVQERLTMKPLPGPEQPEDDSSDVVKVVDDWWVTSVN